MQRLFYVSFFLSYAVSFVVCFVVLFIVFGIVLAVSLDGTVSKSAGSEYVLGAVLIVAVLFVPFFTAMCKWLMLKLMKIQKAAFTFSLISSLIMIIVSVGVPWLITYLVWDLKI